MSAEPSTSNGFELIDSVDGLHRAIDALHGGHGPIGVDAERASGFRYSQRAYLIQVHRRDAGTFLFDPPQIGSFAELNDELADEEWILHAATQDLTCLREVGLDPQQIFDTELAARLLGMPRVGLATVVDELLGVRLAKEHSAVDWSTRPLPHDWLVYAALDVELLPDLRDAIGARLVEAEKTSIAEQEFESVLHRDLVPVRAEPWRRLSGVHTIRSPRILSVARELWLTRDEFARETDTAPGRLIPDASIVAAARAMPATRRELAALKEFSGRASRSQLDRWWSAIERGRDRDDPPALRAESDALPPPRAWSDRNPPADGRLKGARAALAEIAVELELPPENLLSPETLRRLAWSPPEPIDQASIERRLHEADAREWQIDATAAAITAAFVASDQASDLADSGAS